MFLQLSVKYQVWQYRRQNTWLFYQCCDLLLQRKDQYTSVSTAVCDMKMHLDGVRSPGFTMRLKHRCSKKATQQEELIKLCQDYL